MGPPPWLATTGYLHASTMRARRLSRALGAPRTLAFGDED